MGTAFAVRSVLGIGGLAFALAVVPYPDVTPDLVLTAAFGGFFLISRRADILNVGDVILGFNVVLFVLHGIDEYTAITVVAEQHGTIRARIIGELRRGMTIFKGHGGMSGAERDILYCVVTRLEIGKVKAIVQSIDARAFVVFHPLAGAEGGMIKTRGFH
ncbi:MAG: YitT family protein [Acidobacteriia bacterium]|nr:YitT family protein [Terriglobia bacterium]